MRKTVFFPALLLPLALLQGCQSMPEQPVAAALPAPMVVNTRPDLSHIPLQGRVDFGYQISGDPGAAPTQVFSDGMHLFMQFAPNEAPPIPTTPQGQLLEFEVLQGGLVRMRAAPIVNLRLGPRMARVQKQSIEVIALNERPIISATQVPGGAQRVIVHERPVAEQAEQAASMQPPVAPAAPTSAVVPLSSVSAAVSALRTAGISPRGAVLDVCHSPRVRDFERAQELQLALLREGAIRVELRDTCLSISSATINVERVAP